MLARLAAIATAATLIFSTAQAQPFDPSIYQSPEAMNVLVSGEAVPLMQDNRAQTEAIRLYALALSDRLNAYWQDKIVPDYVMTTSAIYLLSLTTSKIDEDTVAGLLEMARADADTFAASYDFNSITAQSLLSTLQNLLSK